MPERLLFIGHSLVGHKMPEMFNSFVSSLNLNAHADKQVINGSPLRYNWDNGHLAEGVNARDVLSAGNYSAVIVTEALPLDEHIRWNDTHGYADRYYDLAYATNPATQFYVLETWHDIGADTAAWRAQLEEDLPTWEGIADHINANAPTNANPALIVPAGQAMAQLYDAIAAGQVPGMLSIHDIFDDTIHLNDIGNWFMATLQAATVLGIDPATLPAETLGMYGLPYDAPDAALATALSGVVSQTLASYDRDGRDGDIVDLIYGDVDQKDGDTDGSSGGPIADEHVQGNNDGSGQPDAGNGSQVPIRGNNGEIAFGLGFGLSGVADYVSNTPFLDVFKTSRPFLGHEPGRWGGVEYDALMTSGVLDADGWPTFIPDGVDFIGSLILTALPAEMTQAAGRYHVTWEGEGELRIGLSAQDVTFGENEAWFSYTADGSGTVSIEIHDTDPQRTGNYLRDISVVRHEYIAAFEAGEVFNPNWIDVINDAHSLRFMDWMETNNSLIATSADAPQVRDASWSIDGVPLAIMVRLANETETDPWFTIPHLADEGYIRDFVTQVRDTLDPSLKAYFEFSNEVWNFQFEQSYHSHLEGLVRFPGEGSAWVQNYAADAVVMARIIDEVYGSDSPDVVKVIATQTGWIGLEETILDAPAWVAENPTLNATPAAYFDAYGITGYFDAGLGRGDKPLTVKAWLTDSMDKAVNAADAKGLIGTPRKEYIEAHQYDYATTLAVQELRDGSVTGDTDGSLAELRIHFAYHKSVADARNLELVMYEGGTHVVGVGEWQSDVELTAFFTNLNYTAEIGQLYSELLQMWEDEGGTLFNAFTAVMAPSQYGSWGHLRYLGDDNARMNAIELFLTEHPKTVGYASPIESEVSGNIDGGGDLADDAPPETAPQGALTVEGTDLSDKLTGGPGNDTLSAGDGDDDLISGGGSDFLDGGLGVDTAFFSGNQASFTLRLAQTGTFLIDRKSGTDVGKHSNTLVSIEVLDFANKIESFQNNPVPLDQFSRAASVSSSDLADITELYVAYFNRAPDAIGLTYWAAQFESGFDLNRMAISFFEQPETQTTYANVLSPNGKTLEDTEAFVTTVYVNVLGRLPDDAGFAFWVNALDARTNTTPPVFILELLNGAKFPSDANAQTALDQAHIATKTDIGTYFSAIKGLSNVDDAMAAISLFDGSAEGLKEAVDHIDEVYADALDSVNGEFLMQLVGVVDDPFVSLF